MIVYKGVTTYDFIVSEQKRQRDLKQAKLNKKKQKKQAKAAKNKSSSASSNNGPNSDPPRVSPGGDEQQVNRNELELTSSPREGVNGYKTVQLHDPSPHHQEVYHEDLLEKGESAFEEKKGEGYHELASSDHQHQQQVIAFDANCEECEETV